MTTQRIAELEAEVLRLRSVMADVIKAHGYAGGTPIEALSIPFTSAALNELIEKVEKMTIERCAEVHKDAASKTFSASGIVWADKFEREIRSLPTGQIELEGLL